MPFAFRKEGETTNPTAARLYGLGVTAGRLYYYRKNLQGNRTGFISILSEGARFEGDLECDRIIKVYYAGFELPEFNEAGGRNWRFHPGKVTARKQFKTITAAAANALTVAAHGYANGTRVRFSATAGATLPGGLAANTSYYVINATANTFQVALTVGGAAVAISNAGANSPRVYAADGVGLDDPVQGAFEFFPTMLWTASGISCIEVLLPEVYSDGEDEPSRLKVIMRGKKMKTYQVSGNLIAETGATTAEPNNSWVAIDMLRYDAKLPLVRFHRTWVDFAVRADGSIAWAGGNENPDTPTYDQLIGITQGADGALTKTTATGWNNRARTRAIAPAADKVFEVTCGERVSFGFGFTTNAAALDPMIALHFGFHCDWTRELAIFINGVETIVGTWGEGDVLKVVQTEGVFKAYKNSEQLPITSPAVPVADMYGVAMSYDPGKFVTRSVFAPSGTASNPREVNRFDAHVVFPSVTSVPDALTGVMFRAPGCTLYEANGVIKVHTVPDRRIGQLFRFKYDPTDSSVKSNIANGTVSLHTRTPEQTFNFYTWGYRDRDDALLRKKFIPTDRPLLRDAANGQLIDAGLVELGVMHQSLVDRVGESQARRNSDLGNFYSLEGFMDSYRVTKGDFVELVEVIAGVDSDSPILCMVIEEGFKFGQVTTRPFVLQAIVPEWYSDTDHGQVGALIESDFTSHFIKPPVVEDVVLSEGSRRTGDGTYVAVLSGVVTFGEFPAGQQRGRVWWQQPGGAWVATDRVLYPHPVTNSAAFEIAPVQNGVHNVKVVSETMLGVSYEFAAHPAFEFEIEGLPTPPVVISTALSETGHWLPDSTWLPSIRGTVVFDAHPYPQVGRVWWRRPNDARAVNVNSGSDVITVAAHGYWSGMPVGLHNVGGTLPAPLLDHLVYFLRDVTANTFKLALTPTGAAIDLTNDGTGTQFVAPFRKTEYVATPDPVTQKGTFLIEGVEVGTHLIKVVPESVAGVSRPFVEHATDLVNIVGRVLPPAPPSAFTLVYESATHTILGSFTASPDSNVIRYRVTDPDNGNVTVYEGDARFYRERAPSAAGVVNRRAYAINTNLPPNNVSTTYATAIFNTGFALPTVFCLVTDDGDIRTVAWVVLDNDPVGTSVNNVKFFQMILADRSAIRDFPRDVRSFSARRGTPEYFTAIFITARDYMGNYSAEELKAVVVTYPQAPAASKDSKIDVAGTLSLHNTTTVDPSTVQWTYVQIRNVGDPWPSEADNSDGQIIRRGFHKDVPIHWTPGASVEVRIGHSTNPVGGSIYWSPTITHTFPVLSPTSLPDASLAQGGKVTTGAQSFAGEKTIIAAGGARFLGWTSSNADPTTGEIPNNKDWCFHKNTTSGNLYLAVNDGGAIRKTQLA